MLENLLADAIRAPSADNSQPWRFEWTGSELSIRHREPPGPDPFGPGGHAVLLAIGHVTANITQFLDAARVAHQLAWARDPQQGTPYATVTFADALPAVATSAAPWPSNTRHTNRFPYQQSPIPPDARRTIAAAAQDAARVVLIDTPGPRSELASIIERCSAARFCTRELHEWLAASLRYSPEAAARGDGLDIETLHLPPGGAAFLRMTRDWSVMAKLNRLGIYRVLAAGETKLVHKAPALACIVGASDPAGVLAAGRLLARVWSGLNAMGLAVHPYYVVTDQQRRLEANRVPVDWRDAVGTTLARLPALLGLGNDERLHLILRVGRATVEPKRSRRLPLETVFRDLTRPAAG